MKRLLNRLSHLFAFYILIVLVSAALFSVFENRSLADGLWWAQVTALTVGYGDISPVTFGGRIVGALLMTATSLFVIPLIVANMAAKLIVNSDAWTDSEQEELKNTITNIAKKIGLK